MADKDDVLSLLRIADLAKEWPDLRPIHNSAMEELTKIAKEHAEQAAKAKEEADKAKAKEEAEKEKEEADKAKAAGGKKGSVEEEEEASRKTPASSRSR